MTDTAQTFERSVVIVDIVSSTALYERLGDVEARRRVGACLQSLTEQVTTHSGRVVKSMGDGLLCSFVDGKKAIWAAVGMGPRSSRHALRVKVALHRGSVVEHEGDVFGDTVNTAARIAALAKPDEILFTQEVREFLPAFMRGLIRPVPPIEVKGKSEPLALFSLQLAELEALVGGSGGEDDVGKTVVVDRRRIERPAETSRLELAYGDKRLILDPEHKLSVGRDPECGLRITNPFVSRHHARIYYHQGKFVIEDTSSNGTFLVPQWQKKLHLLREPAILIGNGLIYLGADPDQTASEPIRFQEA